MIGREFGLKAIIVAALVVVGVGNVVYADQFSSTSYKIDASVANSVGGDQSSSSYKMTSSGGEALVGTGSSTSYILDQGYVAQLSGTPSIEVASQPKDNNLYYPMDEAAGTDIYDSSSSEFDGTIVGSPTRVAGKSGLGSALTLNGTTDTIRVPSNTVMNATSGTVMATIKTTTTGATMGVFVKPSAFFLGINFNRIALYDWGTNSTCQASTSGGIANGSWHHIAMTYQSGVTNGTKLYIDGVVFATCTMTIQSTVGSVTVGSSNTGPSTATQYFNGTIDEAKYFNRVLSDDEIVADYNAQNSGIRSGITFGTIIPGISNNVGLDVTVKSNSASYSLAIQSPGDFAGGVSDTISPISAPIASPAAWSEGTTKGYGFTVYSAPSLSGVWGGGTNYAAAPASATTFYTEAAHSSAQNDLIRLQFRADVPPTQSTGTYAGQINTIGTTLP